MYMVYTSEFTHLFCPLHTIHTLVRSLAHIKHNQQQNSKCLQASDILQLATVNKLKPNFACTEHGGVVLYCVVLFARKQMNQHRF